jgi:type IV pilus assembly protein PilX
MTRPLSASRPPRRERGVVLVFALIALVITLIGAVAIVRSLNASLFTAGNYGFKRDLANQGERAARSVINLFNTGALAAADTRRDSNVPLNYSAVMLATNAQGIPAALLADDATFAAIGSTANDIKVTGMGVTIRYVVDRMCVSTGAPDPKKCILATAGEEAGTSGSDLFSGRAGGPALGTSASADIVQPVYRVSIRVTGPRRTESFFQTTFSDS